MVQNITSEISPEMPNSWLLSFLLLLLVVVAVVVVVVSPNTTNNSNTPQVVPHAPPPLVLSLTQSDNDHSNIHMIASGYEDDLSTLGDESIIRSGLAKQRLRKEQEAIRSAQHQQKATANAKKAKALVMTTTTTTTTPSQE